MQISQSEWARRQGFSRQYVSKLVKSGIIRLVNGQIDTDQAESALAATREPARALQRKENPLQTPVPVVTPPIKKEAPGSVLPVLPDIPGGNAGDLSTLLLKARIKSEIKRASLLEIREKVESGKLVDSDEMHAAAFNRGRAIRAAWEAWPNRVAGTMGAELGVETRTMRILLEKFVRSHLQELAGMDGENHGWQHSGAV
ncbi:MAG: hypothetical protein HQL76_06195 [Magnetococcales bacterium]|nr:hypothetical protein [Magnetococcales bacterium]